MIDPFELLTITFEGITASLEKQKAENEASQELLSRSQADVKHRNEQLIKERQSVLMQVESIRKEKEENKALLITAQKKEALVKEEREKLETRELLVDQREKKVQQLEKSVAGIVERESILQDGLKNLEEERLYIAKQKTLLDEKQQSQTIIDQQLAAREERLKRLR